jgi:hypothetical protein|tara:strand:+ start:1152 stop:1394 length:243 start_codon:yes stop_codon:yes gene_type:complete
MRVVDKRRGITKNIDILAIAHEHTKSDLSTNRELAKTGDESSSGGPRSSKSVGTDKSTTKGSFTPSISYGTGIKLPSSGQ